LPFAIHPSSYSKNAEYGEYVTGLKVINEESRWAMREALKNINTPSSSLWKA
jgi:ketol-acid reductoisomerase